MKKKFDRLIMEIAYHHLNKTGSKLLVLQDHFKTMKDQLDEMRRTIIAVTQIFDENPFADEILKCILHI